MSTNQMGLASKSKLTAIANAIRTKLGVSTQYSLDDMPTAIASISGGGGITPTGTKQVSITQNGTTTEDVTNYASAEITVNVPSSGITPSGTIQITENGTFDVTQYASAEVNVSGGGGGGAKVLTKLATYTVSDSVATISITATGQMRSCEMLFIECVNLAHTNDWIYPVVNNGAITNGGMGYTSKNSNYNSVLFLVVPRTETIDGASVTVPARFFGNLTGGAERNGYLTSIDLKQYSSSSVFTGGTVNVWGYV